MFRIVIFLGLLWAAPAWAEDVIGQVQFYTIQKGDVFVDIARRFDLGYNEIRAANATVDPWIPPVASKINLPLAHILPDAPRRGIVINLAEQRLYYFLANGEIRSFPIGVVKEGWTMPRDSGRIVGKRKNPTWIPPASIRAEHPELPESIAPGPNNPLGDYALDTSWTAIRIHGTNKPMGVGRRVTHGCIRLYPEDIAWLFNEIKIGAPVTIVNQPIKAGWRNGALYLQVHPRMEDANHVETYGQAPAPSNAVIPATLATVILIKAAGDQASRIDWDAVQTQVRKRDGLIYRVTR